MSNALRAKNMRNKDTIKVKYKCLGASREVTGSCHYLNIKVEDKEFNIVVDYGGVQDNIKKLNELYKLNKQDKAINWSNVLATVLTHSHSDHSMCLPVAVMNGYEGSIYCTAPSIELTRLILTDSAFIQDKETERYNKTKDGKKNPIAPIYGMRHVEATMDRFRGYDYNVPIQLNEYITLTLKPTGHLLGACSPYIEIKNGDEVKWLLFTGDTSANKDLPFVMSPNFEALKVQTIFCESTYGNSLHKKTNIKKELTKHIKETCIEKNGQLILPTFAIGRTSSLMAMLYEIFQSNKELDDIPVYLASPMANKAHRIYGHADSFNFYDTENKRYKDMFNWSKVEYIEEYKLVESQLLNNRRKIVIAASGMIEGGYSTVLASSVLPNSNNKILFVGYQGLGTTGRHILESEFGQSIKIDGKTVKRKCDIGFVGMSSHADYQQLIDMIKTMAHTKIKNIFLNHGDNEVIEDFKKYLEKEFNCNIIISEKDKWYTL
jgi:metallo-beta-lactamase family protein